MSKEQQGHRSHLLELWGPFGRGKVNPPPSREVKEPYYQEQGSAGLRTQRLPTQTHCQPSRKQVCQFVFERTVFWRKPDILHPLRVNKTCWRLKRRGSGCFLLSSRGSAKSAKYLIGCQQVPLVAADLRGRDRGVPLGRAHWEGSQACTPARSRKAPGISCHIRLDERLSPLGQLPVDPNEARALALHSSDLLTRSGLGLQLPAFLRGLKRRKCCGFFNYLTPK